MHEKPDQEGEVSLYRARNQTIEASSDLARIFHESLTATTNMGILPAVLGCWSLRRTIQVRLGTNTLRLPGGPPIFVLS